MDTVRIDKWLWAARMYKTRSQATRACTAGHVTLNGLTAKAASKVQAGVEYYESIASVRDASA